MIEIETSYILLLFGSALFCIGLYAAIARKNLILVLIGIELMLNGSIVNLVVFDQFFHRNQEGEFMSLFAMVLSAASIALALAIIIKTFKYKGNINPDSITELKN
jgi:NADH:ubiquinone oxidoreductase subunit K